jgi:hypothetical protein
MNLTEKQQITVELLNKLITDKYQELIWDECYYPEQEEGNNINHLLSKLMEEGVEVNFSVNVTPYDNKL